jgi:hypothetical protein
MAMTCSSDPAKDMGLSAVMMGSGGKITAEAVILPWHFAMKEQPKRYSKIEQEC